ncbi:uncharacterized protein LOC117650354 isoform X1 [Thrips palmi]|uniref:Uncharacterized protein LOC117650354 isoform X1 n=1 Tax=Thrips palmi TaxID=161013 RepID=A0A6P8ZWU4_THRPL|nr:uncharacterized protein LOC117650354 isoform X1 [Thrips palmi]
MDGALGGPFGFTAVSGNGKGPATKDLDSHQDHQDADKPNGTEESNGLSTTCLHFYSACSCQNKTSSRPDSPSAPNGFSKMDLERPGRMHLEDLPNEISAPYEVPQFPIEQIETKLAMQRQLSVW